MNGDGEGDIAVGASGEDVGGNQEQGRAYVFLSDEDTPTPTPTPTPSPTPTATPTPTPTPTPTATPTATPAPAPGDDPVGGIAVLPELAKGGSPSFDWVAIAALAGTVVVALTAAAWYTRRRRVR
jgi:hypothetical protein